MFARYKFEQAAGSSNITKYAERFVCRSGQCAGRSDCIPVPSRYSCERDYAVRRCEGSLLWFQVHPGLSATISMRLIVTRRAQCDQVLFFICAGVTAELHVMHF